MYHRVIFVANNDVRIHQLKSSMANRQLVTEKV